MAPSAPRTPTRARREVAGPPDALTLAVEAAAALQPFGVESVEEFEVRWTFGPDASSVFVPFQRDGGTPMSVMVRLTLP